MDEITHRKIRNAITTAPKLGLTWRDLNSQNTNEITIDPDKLKMLVLDFLKVTKRRKIKEELHLPSFFSVQSWCLVERLRRCSVTFCIRLRGIKFTK